MILLTGCGSSLEQKQNKNEETVMSKKALLRDISVPHKDADYAKLEEEIMEMV